MLKLIIIYQLLLVLIAVFGLVNYSKLSRPYLFLTLLILVTLAEELSVRIIGNRLFYSSLVYHIYTPILFCLMSYVYYFIGTRKGHSSKVYLTVIVIFFIILSMFNSIYMQPVGRFPTIPILIAGVIYVFFSMNIIYSMMKSRNVISIAKEPAFWYVLGTIVFYSIHVFIFGIYNYFLSKGKVPNVFHYLNWSANVFMYFCYGLAIYTDMRTNRKERQSSFFPQSQEKP